MAGARGSSNTSYSIIDGSPIMIDTSYVPIEDAVLLEPHCCLCLKFFSPGDGVIPITGKEGNLDHQTMLRSWIPYPRNLAAVDSSELAWRRKQKPEDGPSIYFWSMDYPEAQVATLHRNCYACLPWLANLPVVFSAFRWKVLCATPATGCPAQTVKPIPPNRIPLMVIDGEGNYMIVNGHNETAVRSEIDLLRRILEMRIQVQRMIRLQRVPVRFPLSTVQRWTRNKAIPKMLSLAETPAKGSIWRIHMDEHGVFEIEKLSAWPKPYTGVKNPFCAWALVGTELARKMTLIVKQGLARLELPVGCSGLQIWDTPTPPCPDETVHMPTGVRSNQNPPLFMWESWFAECRRHHRRWLRDGLRPPADLIHRLRFYRRLMLKDLYVTKTLVNSFRHFFTVPLTHGVTFLYDDENRLVELYPGYLTLEGNAGWPARRSQNVSYIHVPLAEGDEIEEIGAKGALTPTADSTETYQAISFSIVSKMAGETLVGPDTAAMTQFPSVRCMLSHSPHHMVYCKKAFDDRVDVVGAIPEPDEDDDRLRQFNGFKQSFQLLDSRPPLLYSEAPLTNVVHVAIFCAQEMHVSGLLLRYKNGALRAMGEYRPGMVPTRSVRYPTRLCLDLDLHRDGFRNVDFVNNDAELEGCTVGSSYFMRGLLTLRWEREVIEDPDMGNDDDETLVEHIEYVEEVEEPSQESRRVVQVTREGSKEIIITSQFRVEETDKVFPTDLPYNPWENTGFEEGV